MKKDTTSGKGSLSGKDSAMNQGKCSAKPDWKKIPISRKAYKDFVARIICVLEAVTQSQALVNEALEMFERYLKNEDIDIVGADPAVQIAFLMIRGDIVKAINRSYAARLRASARKLKKLVAEYPCTNVAPDTPTPALPSNQNASPIGDNAENETSENVTIKNETAENGTVENETVENDISENESVGNNSAENQIAQTLPLPIKPVIKPQPQPYINPFNQPAALMNRRERRQHERELRRMQKH